MRRLVVLLFLGVPALRAQGTVRGVVFDSLRAKAPLAGAQVVVRGSPVTATTDRAGRYTLRDVPPGRQVVTFFHATLDSLEISVPPREIDVPARGSATLALAIPSMRGISRQFCDEPPAPLTAIVFGVVRAAEDDAPLADATATVRWYEVSILSGVAQQSERIAESRTIADGRYVLCGVPNDVAVSMRVTSGAQASGLLHLWLDGEELARRDVVVSLSDTAARAGVADPEDDTTLVVHPRGTARLRLRVLDDNGRPLRGATVGVRGTSVSGLTGDDGRATLLGAPAGSQTIVARAIGKAPALRVVALAPHAQTEAELRLPRLATALPRVAVTGTRAAALDAWELRRRSGVGSFWTERELQALRNGTSFWARVPGIMIQYQSSVGSDPMPMMQSPKGGYCFPAVWLDGAKLPFIDAWELRILMLDAKRAEVYPRPGLLPHQFASPNEFCGAIIIWTN